MNRKGLVDQMVWIMTLVVILAIIIVFVWGGMILMPMLTGVGKDITGSLVNMSVNSGDGNLTTALSTSTKIVDESIGNLEWVTYAMLIALFLGFLGLCFYVRTYPFLLGFWIVGIIVMAILSLFLTDAYQTAVVEDSSLSVWVTSHYIMSNLPMIIVGIGIVGGVILFSLITRDNEAEVSGL